MKINKNIVIACLARDCDKSLLEMIKLIEDLRERFVWSEVVVVENDSKDNTKKILFDWEQGKEGVKIISHDYGTLTIPEKSADVVKPLESFHRIGKMVMYRNIYLKYIKGINHDIDNVIVVDLDIESFSVDGVVESIIRCDGKCGAIFANGVTVKRLFGTVYSKIFYDVFAVYEYPMKSYFSYSEETLETSFNSLISNLKKDKLYKIISAFGGIGVYNYNSISELEYNIVSNGLNEDETLCEHIPFNLEIINLGYENFISRELEVIYGEHSFGSVLKYYLPKKIFYFLLNSYHVFRNS
jgi:hypothetical protein